MDARMFAGGSVKRFQYLFLGLLFSIFTAQCAQAAPVVVSVDHRVAVTYSKPQFDARKGILTVQARIKNRSDAVLLSPLQLSFDQAALKNLRIQNAQGIGKDGRPYFNIKLPKGMLLPKASSAAINIVVAFDKRKVAKNFSGVLASRLLNAAQHVSAGVEGAILGLSATPDAMAAQSGKQLIRFGVPVLISSDSTKPVAVYLRRKGGKQRFAMNDLGKDGDFIAGDGVYGVVTMVDASQLKSDSCLRYEAILLTGRSQSITSPLDLCVSEFPLGIADSNLNLIVTYPGKTNAVADELLITVKPLIGSARIRELANGANGKVVGTILPLNFYQIKLAAPLDSGNLLELLARLKKRPEVVNASFNAIGQVALNINDTSFDLPPADVNSQHGLKLVLAHNQANESNAWDVGAVGTGVTVVVMDTGLESSHSDLNAGWTCQSGAMPVAFIPCTDTAVGPTAAGHGTQVAGVIAASTNNGQGIAGAAYGASVHAIKMNNFTTAGMVAGFQAAAGYVGMNGNAKVINASFNVLDAFSNMDTLCGAIESVVSTAGVPRAIVVNAAGNQGLNGYSYPARCKDSNPFFVSTDLLIAVSNSASFIHASCGSVGENQRCAAAVPADPNQNGSNFGNWVDIAAPGSAIRTTTIGNTYASVTGTSFSTPFVSSAVAMFSSCGMSLNQIKSTLTSSANVPVSYPAYPPYLAGTTPRLDIYRALQSQVLTAPTLSAPESYTEGVPLNLTNIVIASNLSGCATFTATLTISDIAAGSLTTGTSGAVTSTFVGGVWTASGPMADVNALLAGVMFNPSPNYSSDFTITTSVSDGISTINGSKAMHGLAVNSAPVAVDDALSSVAEDSGMRTIPSAVLTGNDDDGDPEVVQTLTITGVSNPVGGTVAINGANIEFMPTGNFNGTASFDYTVQDNGQTNGVSDFKTDIGSVSFSVTPVNDVPVAVVDALSDVAEDSGMRTIPFAMLTGNDADGDPEVVQMLTITSVSNPVGGTVAINGANVEFMPTGNFNGTASFDYTVQDNGQTNGSNAYMSGTGSVSFTVTPVNDVPVAANDTLSSVAEDSGMRTIPFATLTGNDADGDPEVVQTLTITGVSNPVGGTVVINGANVEFTPTASFNGAASFDYTVQDNGQTNGVNDFKTDIGSVSFTVTPVNNVPVAVDDVLSSVAEDSGMRTIPFAALTGNDADGDAEVVQTLTISAVSNPVGGTVVINGANVEFTPTANYNGAASFDYTVQDNGQTNGVNDFKTDIGSVSFTVTPVNDAPSGSDGPISMNEDATHHFVAADFGFSDMLDSPSNGLSAIQITSVPSPGALELGMASVGSGQIIPIADLGGLTFRPVGDANGSPYASFTFQVVDDGGNNGANGDVNTDPTPNTLTINVNPAEDPLSGLPVIDPAASPATRKIGAVLTAVTDGSLATPALTDADCPPPPLIAPPTSGGLGTSGPCELAYQWKRSPTSDPAVPGDPISGATNQTYTLKHIDATNTDFEKYMSLCVSTGSGAAYSYQCTVNESTAVGDPHITTVDGLHYDFQGEGDFVALRGDNGMEIQLRMSAVSTAPPLTDPYTGLSVGVSVNSAVAARVGQRRVSYQPGAASGTFVLSVDGVPMTAPADGIDLGNGGRVLPLSGGGIQIDFPDQTTLMVSAPPYTFYNASWLHISVFHTTAYKGIMGARSKGSWLPALSDGSALGAKPAALHDRYVQLYEKFADSWRVNKETSLFDTAAPTPEGTIPNRRWPMEKGPYVRGNVPVAKPLGLRAAELACKGILGKNEKADCIFDVRVVGNKGIAKGHLLNQKIRLGAVNVIVRPAGKLNAKGEMVVTATVARHAMVVPKVKGVRAVPAGAVQFMLGDKPLGKPVKLDAKGQAKLVVTRQNMERFNVGKLAITAQYLPAKDRANVFLPSVSRKLTRELVRGK